MDEEMLKEGFNIVKGLLKEMADDEDLWIYYAIMVRKLFNALRGQGFSEEESLDILTKMASAMQPKLG